ncbi:T9SS C-terminal target domain-containing protein [Kaistella haifensis]|nr:T9SS C-terminal target domain-containing protein [Kaistella haifensis]
MRFSIQELPSGIYLVKVMTDKGMMTSKIIKK